MNRFIRLFSGAAVGAALLTLGTLAGPAPARAAAGGGFCDETENYVCCCSTDAAGRIVDCRCQQKAAPAPSPYPA